VLFTNAFASRKRSAMKIVQSLKQVRVTRLWEMKVFCRHSLYVRNSYRDCRNLCPCWRSAALKREFLLIWLHTLHPLASKMREYEQQTMIKHWPVSPYSLQADQQSVLILWHHSENVCQEEHSSRHNYDQFIKMKPLGWKWTLIIWNYNSCCTYINKLKC
jgi:hypothetical protein